MQTRKITKSGKKPCMPNPSKVAVRRSAPPSVETINTTNEARGRKVTPALGHALTTKFAATQHINAARAITAERTGDTGFVSVSRIGTARTPAMRAFETKKGSSFVVRTAIVTESPGFISIGMIFSVPATTERDGVMSAGFALVTLERTISALFADVISRGDSKSVAGMGLAPSFTSSKTVRYGVWSSTPAKETWRSSAFAVSGGCNEVCESFRICNERASRSARQSQTGIKTPAKVATRTTQNFQSKGIVMINYWMEHDAEMTCEP